MTIKYSILSDEQFHKFLGGYEDYDVFKVKLNKMKDNFKYGNVIFDGGYNDHVYFIAMDSDDEVVGILKFKIGGEDSLGNPGFKNWICFIDVAHSHRNKGIANTLCDLLFAYCQENGLNVLGSGFTLLGHKYIMKKLVKSAIKTNIEYAYKDFVDHPNWSNFEGMDEAEYRAYYEEHGPHNLSFEDQYKYIIVNEKKTLYRFYWGNGTFTELEARDKDDAFKKITEDHKIEDIICWEDNYPVRGYTWNNEILTWER